MGGWLDRLAGEAAHERAGRPPPKHLYQTCDDEDCPRLACRAYREGYEQGNIDGYRRGYAAGQASGKN